MRYQISLSAKIKESCFFTSFALPIANIYWDTQSFFFEILNVKIIPFPDNIQSWAKPAFLGPSRELAKVQIMIGFSIILLLKGPTGSLCCIFSFPENSNKSNFGHCSYAPGCLWLEVFGNRYLPNLNNPNDLQWMLFEIKISGYISSFPAFFLFTRLMTFWNIHNILHLCLFLLKYLIYDTSWK